MADAIAQFANAKYLNLETFRKTGVGVRTPVWFAQEGDIFYVYALADSERSNVSATTRRYGSRPATCAATCAVRGWTRMPASANGAEAAGGQELLRHKYGWIKIVGDFFSRMRGRTQAVIAIEMG